VADLLHPRVARRLAQQPERQPDAVADGDAGADEGEENRMVVEEVDLGASLTKSTPRLLGAAVFYHSRS
jgi:hypothetical protein